MELLNLSICQQNLYFLLNALFVDMKGKPVIKKKI